MMTERERQLQEVIKKIRPADAAAMEKAQEKWNSIAKPLHSLGKLETQIIRIAGMTGSADVKMEKKALIVMCADNGVVTEGVTQTGQEVTKIVAENFLTGMTSAALMCKKAGVDLFPVDIGMAEDSKVPARKIAYGTRNMVKEPAMTREEALQGILIGIDEAKKRITEGYQLLATGEMGIGNTTTSSAVAAVLLNQSVSLMTGRGAGLSGDGLDRKIRAIKGAISLHKPDPKDPVEVLAAVGGFDLAGLTGVFLGGAMAHVPVVIDGFISAVAALIAVRLCPAAGDYMIASHVSKEPGMKLVLEALHREASLTCDLCLGEGTGGICFIPVLELALEVYQKMSTFAENSIEDYEDYGEQG